MLVNRLYKSTVWQYFDANLHAVIHFYLYTPRKIVNIKIGQHKKISTSYFFVDYLRFFVDLPYFNFITGNNSAL